MATSPAIRRTQHREELRSIILDAARQLFVDEGFETFSMRKLAGRVGYSAASLYQHFASKEEIFYLLIEESFAALAAAQTEAAREPEPDPLAALARGLRAYVRFGLENQNQYRFAFLMPSKGARSEASVRSFDGLRRRVKACIEAGLFRRTDSELAAQVLWSAVHGITSLLIVRPQFAWVEREVLIEQVIQNAIHGMCLTKA